MKDNEMKLNGLIEEVLVQMRERKYGPKFTAITSIAFHFLNL